MKALWKTPEYRAKMSKIRSEQASKRWAEGNWRNSIRVSSTEYLIAPKLEADGFVHNIDAIYTIKYANRTRIPDFINLDTKDIVEVWGDYWHKGQDPKNLITWYAKAGYKCRVVWEHEINRMED